MMLVRPPIRSPRGKAAASRRATVGAAVLLGFFAVLACTALLAGCDRTTKRGAMAESEASAATAGLRAVPGGVQFTFVAPEAQTVHLAGSFNNWSTSADPLKKDAQGQWTITKPLPAGTHQYKFAINGGQQWKDDPNNSSSADDGFGGKNSVLVVGPDGKFVAMARPELGDKQLQVTFTFGRGKAASPSPESGGGKGPGPQKVDTGWLFTFDMPSAQSVHLAGSFNSWSTSADPMTKNAQGLWTITKPLPAGTHQYKLVINGGQQWKEDPNNSNTADDGYGGKNSVLVIGAEGAATGGEAGAGAAGPAGGQASTPIGRQPMQLMPGEGPQKVDGGWQLTFDLPSAQSLALAGSFNGWSTSADPLQKNAAGRWTITKQLPAGTHHYKFVVDGQRWMEDPSNPNTADDGFGGKNSVLVVP